MEVTAFFGDPKLKQTYIDDMQAHRGAEQLVPGIYWESDGGKDGKGWGCALGCLTHQQFDAHKTLERESGIPESVGRMIDGVFEQIARAEGKSGRWDYDSSAEHLKWPTEFLEAVQPGADLSNVHHQFVLWFLSKELPKHLGGGSGLGAFIKAVQEIYQKLLDGETPSKEDFCFANSSAAHDGGAHNASEFIKSVLHAAKQETEYGESYSSPVLWQAIMRITGMAEEGGHSEGATMKRCKKAILKIVKDSPLPN